ncbi:MAG: iron-siderophore ABC transporter substrate-binding protein [Chloroflexi bacterium]|nr:iron-siderophore ABC transporter substrate-binding protein [Chloroflexota bacterium]
MISRLSILLAMIALLAACGGTPASQETATQPAAQASALAVTVQPSASAAEQTSTPATEQTSTSTTAATGAESVFPVNITHKHGTTTIPAAPQRVVSLGYSDQDPILALGTKPVAVRYWFGDTAQAVWPWAQAALGDAKPEILNMPFGELNIETIAALKPDLIVAVSSGITQEEYTTLSAIAPTVAQSADYVDFGVPWQEQTQVIGQALGQAAQAETLVADMEQRFTQIRAEHPEFEGATAAIAAPAPDGQYYFSGPEHERQRYLSSLGFKLPDELTTIAGDAFYGTISGEQLSLLDTDVLIWTVSPEERVTIESNPIYQQLSAVKAGRVIFLDTSGNGEDLGPALVYSSVLSLPLVHDELVPQLAAAMEKR